MFKDGCPKLSFSDPRSDGIVWAREAHLTRRATGYITAALLIVDVVRVGSDGKVYAIEGRHSVVGDVSVRLERMVGCNNVLALARPEGKWGDVEYVMIGDAETTPHTVWAE